MYSYTSKIRYSETNENLQLTYIGLVNYFQDAAIFEAETGSADMNYLKSVHLAWLLGSWQILIKRMPRFNEEVVITTIPYEFKGFLGYRNFSMTTKDGELLAMANSIWTLVDMAIGKPARITEDFKARYVLGERMEMENKPRKIMLEGEGIPKESTLVHKSQIDSNKHMNNAEYVGLAMEQLPTGKTVKEIRVEYKNPAFLQDAITPVVHEGQDMVQVELLGKDSTYAVVEMSF